MTDQLIDALNTLTKKFIDAKTVSDFQMLMLAHESIVSKLIGIEPVKEAEFSDYEGVVKSLGAWGGDFVLACGSTKSKEYFMTKGFKVCFAYTELISTANLKSRGIIKVTADPVGFPLSSYKSSILKLNSLLVVIIEDVNTLFHNLCGK